MQCVLSGINKPIDDVSKDVRLSIIVCYSKCFYSTDIRFTCQSSNQLKQYYFPMNVSDNRSICYSRFMTYFQIKGK